MNIKITEKELKVTEAIKEYVEKKSERLVKYFGDEFDVTATLSKSGFENVATMKVVVGGEVYKAETAHKDLYAAIDKDIDVLEGQIRKMKTKKDKQNMTESIRVQEDIKIERKEIENEIQEEQNYIIQEENFYKEIMVKNEKIIYELTEDIIKKREKLKDKGNVKLF